ncbi:MAG: hypothetical protein ACKV19_17965 [Verrucomicrobiales bacterium]
MASKVRRLELGDIPHAAFATTRRFELDLDSIAIHLIYPFT